MYLCSRKAARTGCASAIQASLIAFGLHRLCSGNQFARMMGYSNHDKLEWTIIFASEFGRRFGLTLKQAFNYLSRFGGIKFVDEHYDYCHTQSFQSMVSDIAEYCHKKGGALV